MFKKACRLFYVVCLPVTLLVEESCSLRPVLFVSQQLMHIVHLLRQRVLHAHTHTHVQTHIHYFACPNSKIAHICVCVSDLLRVDDRPQLISECAQLSLLLILTLLHLHTQTAHLQSSANPGSHAAAALTPSKSHSANFHF